MNPQFAQLVGNSNAHRREREANASAALRDPVAFRTLLALAREPALKGHVQSWWALEIICEHNADILLQNLSNLVFTMPALTSEGAIRSAAKICMMATTMRLESIPQNLVDSIRDVCLLWLTGDHKVAARAYAARALFRIGKDDRRFLSELREILEVGFPKYSAAYRAMARDLVKKINRIVK